MRTRSSRVVKEDEVEPYISPASDDGDDDDSPEEVSIKTVRLEAKQQRKREYTAKETAAKAEKAKKRRFNRQQDDNESEKLALAVRPKGNDTETLSTAAVDADTDNVEPLLSIYDDKKATKSKRRKGPRKVGPVEVVTLPEAGFDFSAKVQGSGERESATEFWQQQFQKREQARSSNSLKGCQPNMIVQPRRGALYGPHVDFR